MTFSNNGFRHLSATYRYYTTSMFFTKYIIPTRTFQIPYKMGQEQTLCWHTVPKSSRQNTPRHTKTHQDTVTTSRFHPSTRYYCFHKIQNHRSWPTTTTQARQGNQPWLLLLLLIAFLNPFFKTWNIDFILSNFLLVQEQEAYSPWNHCWKNSFPVDGFAWRQKKKNLPTRLGKLHSSKWQWSNKYKKSNTIMPF